MRLPEETVVDSFLPTFRFMLARELADSGLKEGQIARAMGLSQAAVSKYRLGKTKTNKFFLEDQRTRELVRQLGSGLKSGEMSQLQALSLIMQLIKSQQTRGILCRLHEDECAEIAGTGCNLCLAPSGSDILEEEAVLTNLRTALRLLESTERFPTLIPNVGTNLAMAKNGAEDLRDVAAVPGRIYVMKGGVKIPAAPEFEASTHVAGLVVAISKKSPGLRAAINIKYSDENLAACTALGWRLLEVAGEYKDRHAEIVKKLSKLKTAPNVIYHRGAFGIEPMVYIIGESATNVVGMVRQLLEHLKA